MNQDLIIQQLEISFNESLSDMEADYQTALADLDARVDELSSGFNEKLAWTWGSVGVFGLLLLGIWRIWQIRLRRG